MKILPEELTEKGYQLCDQFEHTEIVPFIQPYLKPNNPVMIFYWGINIIILLAAAIGWITLSDGKSDALAKFGIGAALFAALIPIHELIHGIGYKLAGAPKVSYKAHIKKLIFYAMADRFVISARPFVLLAIAPFIIINSLLIIGIAIFPGPYSWLLAGALLMHTSGCAGDFALISYYYVNRRKEIVTYDDQSAQITYFFTKL
jgi:Putative zincin peptidase